MLQLLISFNTKVADDDYCIYCFCQMTCEFFRPFKILLLFFLMKTVHKSQM